MMRYVPEKGGVRRAARGSRQSLVAGNISAASTCHFHTCYDCYVPQPPAERFETLFPRDFARLDKIAVNQGRPLKPYNLNLTKP